MIAPVIVLVGRPNVGKSTLFNYLTKTRHALVADYPGLTRDRQIHPASFKGQEYFVMDTGGLGVDDRDIDKLMSQQTQNALKDASLIFFVVDAKSGLTPVDETIAKQLRKLGRKVFLLINKIDGLDKQIVNLEFNSLGFQQTFLISASHGTGIDSLLTEVFAQEIVQNIPLQEAHPDAIEVAFIGRPNVGKSTLVNRILGEERVVVYDKAGTTRDSIAIPFARNGQNYVLIDTAGVRRRARVDEKIEKISVIKTLQSITAAKVCLMIFDASEGITDQDLHLLGLIMDAGKALILVVNKWDNLTLEKKQAVESAIERRLRFAQFAKLRLISALHGTNVGLLFKDIQEAYRSSIKKISPAKLTESLTQIVAAHQPPLIKGRRIKLRYAHFGGHNPPMIVIHGNQLDKLPASYVRYLSTAFMQSLALVGTPIKFEFKVSENPFAGKKNSLTQRQIKRKKRLLKHVKS